MKATAIAPANIALIKYWGRKDAKLRLPANPSISMNLSACITTTTVEFSSDFENDVVTEGFDNRRILDHIDRIRNMAGKKESVHIVTNNSFPTSAGIASSASGFAALTVAAATALNLQLSEKELSAFARLGSGSASRSIPDGFVKWEGEYAHSLYPPDWWDLRDIIVILATKAKKISSSVGHDRAGSSPFFLKRLEALPERIARLETALKTKNFPMLGQVIEEDCLDMHHVMQTQNPPLYYWNEETKEVIKTIRGLPACFTIDAGSNVHVICEAKNEENVIRKLRKYQLIVNKPALGAHII